MALILPVGLKLAGRECLVVGGSEVARRKVQSLVDAEARVTVIAPRLAPLLQTWVEAGTVRWVPREYRTGDVMGFSLVIAATDVEAINRQVAEEARAQGILVNVCDAPELCDFIMPAVVRRGHLTLAVFTDGQSPMLARRIREDLERQYGPEYAEFLELLGSLRHRVRREVPDPGQRREIFRRLVCSDALDELRRGRRDRVEARAEELMARVRTHPESLS